MPFFKKKKKENETKTVQQQEVKKEHLSEQIEEYLTKLESTESEDQIHIFNMLGSLYFEMEDHDNAIKYYEKSIDQNKTLGKVFTDLIKLYNIKRKEATKEGDREAVQVYLQKSDDLMKLTKDTIRGNM
ncbi:Tetratricopeptide repeat-containing protein [Gracilibacillus orientalis]|uniref:Tetratricopeptide repeat-containing protein n=1 Tax=Gracilibacillus orientalis TaxID=334253 RepID=A0A1I4J1C5_9BACI|nr:tetratricopeptide repeat protein [Gracilibacillus orientalis]SFL59931.1 Tetratricopeptide repeat-containing protein [Gracilibacillus orientalis]